MRVLARLLGSNIGELVERIAGGGKDAAGGGRAPDMQERVLCARLLASMAQDDEHAAALLANDAALVQAGERPLHRDESPVGYRRWFLRIPSAGADAW